MHSHGETMVLTYNGEIYNYAELRSELEACGAQFRGHSDTEVMLAAFERFGIEQGLKRLAGMFALGLWDRKNARSAPLDVFWRYTFYASAAFWVALTSASD